MVGKDPACYEVMPTGLTLKQARERVSLSLEEIANRTKIQVERLEALEADQFDVLPKGIYLDGIIRAYAHEVGIDPEPFVEYARRAQPEVAAIWNAPIMLDTVQPAHHSDDAAVLRSEDTIRHAISTEDDEWMRPRKMELAMPTFSVVALAFLMALFYQATHPLEPEPVREAVTHRTTPPQSVAAQPVAARSTSANVSGAWALATHVESSSYAPYAGMDLGFEVDLQQDGDRVVGIGRKVIENGDELDPSAQTPIVVDGTIDGERLVLDFTERGMRRPTHGTFELTLARNEHLQGRFETTAARSSGIVMARRAR